MVVGAGSVGPGVIQGAVCHMPGAEKAGGSEPNILEWAEHNRQVAEATNLQTKINTVIRGSRRAGSERPHS
jgi:hypothetical protein